VPLLWVPEKKGEERDLQLGFEHCVRADTRVALCPPSVRTLLLPVPIWVADMEDKAEH
jgi:hypothetical protein